jgi:Flp pilus assembly protein TadD
VPDPRIADAESAIRARDWDRAIRILHRVTLDLPDSADAYNYLGYSYRRLGDPERALIYYRQALYLDPSHRGALEYLGELYLEMSDLPNAEELLARLARLCGGTCSEYRDLHEQVQRFKAGHPRG